MIVVKGFTFDAVETARDIWFITYAISTTNNNHRVPFVSIYNTPENIPTVGSLLIYQPNTQNPHGHVSVVSDIKDDKIYVSEQNKDNHTYWKGPYARIIHIVNNSITHEPYLIGWKTIHNCVE